jgi:deoxyribose-phosphate aldolase
MTKTLARALLALPGVDQIGAEARAAALATRSIKSSAKAWAIDTAISMIDLTTLEGADTHGKVRAMCAKGRHPDPGDLSVPSVAAICVYPDLVATAVEAVRGSGIAVASVATAFPSGRAALATKLVDVAEAVAAGATEIDMVIDRGAYLSGHYEQVFDEIVAVKAACGDAHLKVILETGELVTLDNVRRASWLALLAGADLDRQGHPGGHPDRGPGDARGGARLRGQHRRPTGRQVGRRDSQQQGRGSLSRDGQRGRGRTMADPSVISLRRIQPAQRPVAAAT